MPETKSKYKLPKYHESRVSWYKSESDNEKQIPTSIITYHIVEQRYYLWKVLPDGKLEKMKTRNIPNFTEAELNGEK